MQPHPAGRRARPWRLLLAVCVGLAALSLLWTRSPTYDPWAWLIWGRQIIHLELHTVGGPSWKPLPVIFTTPFAAVGSGAAPLLWLVVARAGGLLALALAYRLAARIAGPVAGVIAALALLASSQFVWIVARGDSEGVLVAVVLWGIERHLDGARRSAFALGVAAALMRPELWPFVGLYGLWLVREARPGRERARALALAGGSFAAIAVLWFVPEYIGSGNFLRAASRALEPVAGSPALADHPFVAVFTNSAPALAWPVYAGGVLAVVIAAARIRRRGADREHAGVVLALAAGSTLLMIIVATLAVVGFTGNIRYVTLPAAIVCVLGGIGWAQAGGLVRARLGAVAAAALTVAVLAGAAPAIVSTASAFGDELNRVRADDRLSRQLPVIIDRAGGRAAVLGCGRVVTGPFETQMVAWYLRVRQSRIHLQAAPPATVLARAGVRQARDSPLPVRLRSGLWVLRSSCPPR
jgi:hypothetical protein